MDGWGITHDTKDITIYHCETGLRKVNNPVSRWWFLVRRLLKQQARCVKRKLFPPKPLVIPDRIVTPVFNMNITALTHNYDLRSIMTDNSLKNAPVANDPFFIQMDVVTCNPKKKSIFT